jgi:AcrR family transcriptional regulator
MLHDAWRRFTPSTLDALRTVLSEALLNPDFRASYMERVIAPTLSLPDPILERLAQATGIGPIDAPLVMRALSSSIMGFVLLRLLGDPWVLARWEGLADHLADLLLNGLLPIGAHERA